MKKSSCKKRNQYKNAGIPYSYLLPKSKYIDATMRKEILGYLKSCHQAIIDSLQALGNENFREFLNANHTISESITPLLGRLNSVYWEMHAENLRKEQEKKKNYNDYESHKL